MRRAHGRATSLGRSVERVGAVAFYVYRPRVASVRRERRSEGASVNIALRLPSNRPVTGPGPGPGPGTGDGRVRSNVYFIRRSMAFDLTSLGILTPRSPGL